MGQRIVDVFFGVFLGTAAVIIACATCLFLAFKSHGSIAIPGIFHAWTGDSEGMLQVRFLPNLDGIIVALLISGALAGILGFVRRHRAGEQE
jgi:hypothetical protein